MWFCSSSTLGVKRLFRSGRSLKLTLKNSSRGLAVFRNFTPAWRDLPILSDMLPLMSKMTPIEIGTSSLEKVAISCSLPSSNTRKFSFSKPVTRRSLGSVTVILTSTNDTSIWIGLLEFCAGSREDRIGGSGPVVCATAVNGSSTQTARAKEQDQETVFFIFSRRGCIGSQH